MITDNAYVKRLRFAAADWFDEKIAEGKLVFEISARGNSRQFVIGPEICQLLQRFYPTGNSRNDKYFVSYQIEIKDVKGKGTATMRLTAHQTPDMPDKLRKFYISTLLPLMGRTYREDGSWYDMSLSSLKITDATSVAEIRGFLEKGLSRAERFNKTLLNAFMPPYLYKYKSVKTIDDLFHLLDIIKNNRIYFPNYDILNDPLEGNIMEIQPIGYAGCGISRAADLEDQVVGNEKRHYHILSLSSKYNDPLMWAHYADNYAGVCLCYGSEHVFGEARPVEYKIEREYYHSVEPQQLPALVRQGFYLKHNEWTYENEWRIVKRFDKKEDDEVHTEFFSYDQTELKGIIIGHNANPELIGLLADYLPKHVKVMKTYVGHRTFQIGILPIKAELQLNGSEPPYITDMESYLNQEK